MSRHFREFLWASDTHRPTVRFVLGTRGLSVVKDYVPPVVRLTDFEVPDPGSGGSSHSRGRVPKGTKPRKCYLKKAVRKMQRRGLTFR